MALTSVWNWERGGGLLAYKWWRTGLVAPHGKTASLNERVQLVDRHSFPGLLAALWSYAIISTSSLAWHVSQQSHCMTQCKVWHSLTNSVKQTLLITSYLHGVFQCTRDVEWWTWRAKSCHTYSWSWCLRWTKVFRACWRPGTDRLHCQMLWRCAEL